MIGENRSKLLLDCCIEKYALFVNITPIMEHATEMPIAIVDFLAIIAKKKKIVAIPQNNGKERNRLFTAYINRQGNVIIVPSTKREITIETDIYVIMIMVQPKI